MKFRKKPVVVEAIKWTGDDLLELSNFIGPIQEANSLDQDFALYHAAMLVDSELYISTLEGKYKASIGDWIIKGVKGEFYPCKPDIFEMTYELASTLPQQELSDEEIEKSAAHHEPMVTKRAWISACKWYREQLKTKKD